MSWNSAHVNYVLPLGYVRGNVSITRIPKNLKDVNLEPNMMEYGQTKWTDLQIIAALMTSKTYTEAMKKLGYTQLHSLMYRVKKLNVDPLSHRRGMKGRAKVSDAQLIQAYKDCNGIGSHMAKALNVARITIYTRCMKLGLKMKGRPPKK